MSPHSYLHRPVSLLYPIECPSKGNNAVDGGNEDITEGTRSTENGTSDSVPMEDNTEETTTDGLISPVSSTRPIRKATIAARKRIKEWISPEKTMFVWGVSWTENAEN